VLSLRVFIYVETIGEDNAMLKLALVASARFPCEEANAIDALVEERTIR
jgi:hypothetical protein